MTLPVLNRVSFFRLHEWELISALADAVSSDGAESPSDTHDALAAWARMATDVPNGGFTQFFFNNRGDRGVESLANLLESINVPKAGAVIRNALAVFRAHQCA